MACDECKILFTRLSEAFLLRDRALGRNRAFWQAVSASIAGELKGHVCRERRPGLAGFPEHEREKDGELGVSSPSERMP